RVGLSCLVVAVQNVILRTAEDTHARACRELFQGIVTIAVRNGENQLVSHPAPFEALEHAEHQWLPGQGHERLARKSSRAHSGLDYEYGSPAAVGGGHLR